MSVGRFRKRPVVIEAMRFTGGPVSAGLIIQWASGVRHYGRRGNGVYGFYDPEHLVVRTSMGDMRVEIGDWVIRDAQGEFRSCKPDMFEATYEALVDEEIR